MKFLPPTCGRYPVVAAALFSASTFATADEIDFARDIRPILSENCIYCHGPDEEHREADLRLDLKDPAFANHDGMTAFVPGDLEKSEAWYRINTADESELMPPSDSNKLLTPEQIDLLKRWIESGAEWTDHWAFVAPEKPEPPAVTEAASPIDRFILAKLEQKGLTPSPEADRRTLIRRLTLDLTGLPPTPAEVDAFLADQSPDAYEALVNRLLESKHFGERMATYWLDAARYGDTSVMHADGPRDMWPWRDWVVNAFNDNEPFDQFSIEQIAGDLLPNATVSQQIASGFNRNHPSSDEGGAIPEELRVSYVVDRVKTTSNVWLGLSMECAQCHDHKYDPVSQKEYYQLYAYFNNTTDPGMQTRKGNQVPVVEVVTEVEEDKLAGIEKKIESTTETATKSEAAAKAAYAKWPKQLAGESAPAADLKSAFDKLTHWYPLDETSGLTLIDLVARKDAITVDAGITTTERGENGLGLTFDGRRLFDADKFPDYEHNSKLTFSAWLKLDSLVSGAVFSKMDEDSAFRGFDFWLEKGRPGTHLINKWPDNAIKVVADEALTPGKWQHVAITYDGSGEAKGVKVYLDGKLVSSSQVGGKKLTASMKNAAAFRIGGRSRTANFNGAADDLRIYDRVLEADEIPLLTRDLVAEAYATAPDQRSAEQRKIAYHHYLSSTAGAYRRDLAAQVGASREKTKLLDGKTTVMVMEDNAPDKMRPTFRLNRGAYDQPVEDEAISPGVPAVLPPLPADAPENRLGLAKWLFAENHPLTSRVAANQIWQLFFGTGIVETPADFGSQGAFPTHPQLLDWLAVDFREHGWDVKRLIKQIVMSQTYRQSSDLRPGDREADPNNRFLARAPRFRLPAEFIRDNALDLAGLLLRDQMGGPGVKPYQPPGLWAEVGLGGNPKFVQDHDEKLFRRSLYTYWKRSAPPPAMQIFDAPTRETCTLKRPVTNTPLQALAAMNDVQMIEASRHFAERILTEGGKTPETRAGFAFESATAREPNSRELSAILDVYRDSVERYRAKPEMATDLLSAGESKRNESLDPADHAAWTLIASLVLNLDEVLNRN
ncbi:MAG: DUF1553 domain-containing protein [Verrucomicrobiae bacterium]|nr:DUF1553 domain-containing protein [Verrucomicrobiae bacterium]